MLENNRIDVGNSNSSFLPKLESDFFVSWQNIEGEIERGPLNVLWELIRSYQIDIFDVSLERLTKDFLNIVEITKKLEINLAISFACMVARFVYYKSKAILPDASMDEEGEQNKNDHLPPELVEQLLEHRKYKLVAEKLSEIEQLSSGMYTRSSSFVKTCENNIDAWLDLDLNDLIIAYSTLLQTSKANLKTDKDLLFSAESFSVDEQVSYLNLLLKNVEYFSFKEIFEDPQNIKKGEFIASFLAILELSKNGKIIIRQKINFQEIKIFKKSYLQDKLLIKQ